MTEIEEKWEPIEGYEDSYDVSSLGRVRSKRRGHILRGFNNKNNHYHQVMLYDSEGHNKLCYTHLLVAKAFLPPPLNGETWVMHIGDRTDNSVANLMWKHQSIKQNIELAIPDPRIRNTKKECAYIIRRYNKDGRCMAVYDDWDVLEMQGYKKSCILQASQGKYSTNGEVYKKYKWTVEKRN